MLTNIVQSRSSGWAIVIIGIANFIVPLLINISSATKYKHSIRRARKAIVRDNTAVFDLKKTTYGHVLRTGTLEEILEGKDELADGTYDQHVGNYSGEVSRQLPEKMLKANTSINTPSKSNEPVKRLNINELDKTYRPAPLNVRQLNESMKNSDTSGINKGNGPKLSDFIKDVNN